jgi:hypothetical protein
MNTDQPIRLAEPVQRGGGEPGDIGDKEHGGG